MIPVNPPRVMLPMTLFKEVAEAHTSVMSFNKDIHSSFLGRYTHLGTDKPEFLSAVRHDLTKSIQDVLPLLQDEADYAFSKEFGDSTEWKTTVLFPKALQLVSLLSGRIFVGLPLSRQSEWIQSSINYTMGAIQVRREVQAWNPILRPIVAPFLPSVKRINRLLKQSKTWMDPFVKEIIAQNDREKTAVVSVGSRGTWISWLLKYLPTNLQTAERIGIDQLLVRCLSPKSPSANMVTGRLCCHLYHHVDSITCELACNMIF